MSSTGARSAVRSARRNRHDAPKRRRNSQPPTLTSTKSRWSSRLNCRQKYKRKSRSHRRHKILMLSRTKTTKRIWKTRRRSRRLRARREVRRQARREEPDAAGGEVDVGAAGSTETSHQVRDRSKLPKRLCHPL